MLGASALALLPSLTLFPLPSGWLDLEDIMLESRERQEAKMARVTAERLERAGEEEQPQEEEAEEVQEERHQTT